MVRGCWLFGYEICEIANVQYFIWIFWNSETFEYLCDLSRQQINLLLRNILSNFHNTKHRLTTAAAEALAQAFELEQLQNCQTLFIQCDRCKRAIIWTFKCLGLHIPRTKHRTPTHKLQVHFLQCCSVAALLPKWLTSHIVKLFYATYFCKAGIHIWRLSRWDSKMGEIKKNDMMMSIRPWTMLHTSHFTLWAHIAYCTHINHSQEEYWNVFYSMFDAIDFSNISTIGICYRYSEQLSTDRVIHDRLTLFNFSIY